ncbi:ATP-binding protein [Dankookia sp. GCM10030260]|uniref:ATP-binding protein n=1 Tax=Dankookia sp. GCM10030260 TaxID=3273390 RepID=UPI0036132AE8
MNQISSAPAPRPRSEGRQDQAPWRAAALPAAALLLPLLLLGANAWVGWQAAWRGAATELSRTADAAAEYATRVLAGYAFALGRIGDLVRGLPDAGITAREAELHAELHRILADLPQAEAGFVIDRHGYPLLGANIFPIPRGVPTAVDRSFFLALSGPNPPALHVSEVYRNKWDGTPFFALSRRRVGAGNGLPEGEFDGLINVSVFPDTIGEGMRYLLREADDALSLATVAGVVIGRTGGLPMARSQSTRPLPDGIDRELLPDVTSIVDGRQQMIARRRIEGFPLYVAARRPHATIRAAWWRDQRAALLFGLPATLGLFLLALRVQRAQARLGAALDESEDWLRRTTEGAGIGTWESHRDRGTFVISAQCRRVAGLPPGRNSVNLAKVLALIPPAAQREITAMMATARRTGHARMELPIQRPRPGLPPEPAWLAVEAQCPEPGGAAAGRVVGIVYDITARRAAEERAALLLRRSVEQQEAERLRIARDLHDRLGQHLALLHLELGGLAADPAPAARAVRLQAIACAIGEEANRLAVELRPTAIDDLGLETALRQLVEEWGSRTGLGSEIHLRLHPGRLPLPVETTLYRILQEALSNVVKHAGATQVGVTLESSRYQLRMVIEDDGVGMRPGGRGAGPAALGLRGIRERLALLGGSLEIESAPGQGTTLLIGVPL